MVGGGITPDGASFGRLAAKIPARRIPVAVERLVDLYAREKQGEETALAFFIRVPLETLKRELADLEHLKEQDAADEDYIDLGEAQAFVPEVMEGECAT